MEPTRKPIKRNTCHDNDIQASFTGSSNNTSSPSLSDPHTLKRLKVSAQPQTRSLYDPQGTQNVQSHEKSHAQSISQASQDFLRNLAEQVKMDVDIDLAIGMDVDPNTASCSTVPLVYVLATPRVSNGAKPLKGRKRFIADLEELSLSCSTFAVRALSIRNLRPGEDEGSIEFDIVTLNDKVAEQIIASVNLLVSDKSDYPNSHAFFGSVTTNPSSSTHLHMKLTQLLENLSTQDARTIEDTVKSILSNLSPEKCLDGPQSDVYEQRRHLKGSQISDDETNGDDVDANMSSDDDAYDYDYGIGVDHDDLSFTLGSTIHGAGKEEVERRLRAMKRDFEATRRGSYSPGIIHLSSNLSAPSATLPASYYLTASIPIVHLAASSTEEREGPIADMIDDGDEPKARKTKGKNKGTTSTRRGRINRSQQIYLSLSSLPPTQTVSTAPFNGTSTQQGPGVMAIQGVGHRSSLYPPGLPSTIASQPQSMQAPGVNATSMHQLLPSTSGLHPQVFAGNVMSMPMQHQVLPGFAHPQFLTGGPAQVSVFGMAASASTGIQNPGAAFQPHTFTGVVPGQQSHHILNPNLSSHVSTSAPVSTSTFSSSPLSHFTSPAPTQTSSPPTGIPPHALLAWDNRLLVPGVRLVLLIAGAPVGWDGQVGLDGFGLSARTTRSTSLNINVNLKEIKFRVGLGCATKPDREAAASAMRKHGLKARDVPVDDSDSEKEDEWCKEVVVGDGKEGSALSEMHSTPGPNIGHIPAAAVRWMGGNSFLGHQQVASLVSPATTTPSTPSSTQNQAVQQASIQTDITAPAPVTMPLLLQTNFTPFSLSPSLESLLESCFVRIVHLRVLYGVGWAGAEMLLGIVEKEQRTIESVWIEEKKKIEEADQEEALLALSYKLPDDPLAGHTEGKEINFISTAFSYLVRRLTLCTRYCVVCHQRLQTNYEALKPYVCDSGLCAFQYYSLNMGPSLEHEICTNPETVDLLVSLAYIAAAEGVLDEPLPRGMGLRVRRPQHVVASPAPSTITNPQLSGLPMHQSYRGMIALQPSAVSAGASGDSNRKAEEQRCIKPGPDGLVEFDDLDVPHMRAAIAGLIDSLPPIGDMKKYLEKKIGPGMVKPRLKDIDSEILPAAWSILRWCIASCTAHIQELTSPEERVRNIDPAWRQFRFTVGAPDMEAKFNTAVRDVRGRDENARTYPTIFGFHGSSVKNWHSIIRHGLWYKDIANGRAYGHGVYFSRDGAVSMGHYASGSMHQWRNSVVSPGVCVTLAELVNLPSQFVSSEPHYVVGDTKWIMCRYLIVKASPHQVSAVTPNTLAPLGQAPVEILPDVPLMQMDPRRPVHMSGKTIAIPQPSYRLGKMLYACQKAHIEEEYDSEDLAILDGATGEDTRSEKTEEVDWVHDSEWAQTSMMHLMPPPSDSSLSSTMALQKELKTMLKEQEKATRLSELGWYMSPELNGGNLFQWIVELHSFDPDLPIAKDMKAKGLNSLVFEIRFLPTFPISPPFFRIVLPRLLPFINGGGGHVTGGGSICMDLLTTDGWLPSYSISAVLLQIKLAISNPDPRPARLDSKWDAPYSPQEALAGYTRAAATHGWKIPKGIEQVMR